MTRQDILSQYQVSPNGVILSPGKFESEMLYVPYFWEAYMNGMADDDDGSILTFIVNQDDLNEFPELANVKKVQLEETDQGFVYSHTIE
jgi:hypothetical protein